MTASIREGAAPAPTVRSGATWPWSLRARLALATAIAAALTVGAAAWLALTATRQVLTQEVAEAVVRTAERAADSIEVLPDPLSRDAVRPVLASVRADAPTSQQLAWIVFRGRTPRVMAVSDAEPSSTGLEMAQRAFEAARTEISNDEQTLSAAVPVQRDGKPFGVVLARSDLRSMMNLQQRALRSVVVFAVLAAIGLVLLVDLAARSIVYAPVRALRRTLAGAAAGDWSARAEVRRGDEIGQVAQGLNEILARMDQRDETVPAGARRAPADEEAQYAHLLDSYRRVFLLREQLSSAEHVAAVGQTAANIAHEVGTPLNLISGYVQMAKEEVPPDSPIAARLVIIEEQVAKVATTVRAVLDRSRQTSPRTKTTARALLQQASDAIRPNLEAAGVRLDASSADAAEAELLVDATNMDLALHNLLTNAVDATPDGGVITMRVSRAGPGMLRIDIGDPGPGIPAELLPRIFDPFVSTKHPGRASGLGLTIARDVIAAHGGTIAVTSEPGRGTTFTIELPTAHNGSPTPGNV